MRLHSFHVHALGSAVLLASCASPPPPPTTSVTNLVTAHDVTADDAHGGAAAADSASSEAAAEPAPNAVSSVSSVGSVGSVGSVSSVNSEYVLSARPLTLPDDSTVEQEGTHFVFKAHLPEGESWWSSYIEPGGAEIVHNTWMFTRDPESGTARIRRWTPRIIETPNKDKEVTLTLGDRMVAGDWTIELVGVIPGSMSSSGVRVLGLRAVHLDQPVGQWQYDAQTPETHDFPTLDGLHHFQVAVASVKLTPDARTSSVVLRGHAVDLAKKATLGTPIAEGLWVYPDGLRLLFERPTMCAMGRLSVCTTSWQVSAAGTTLSVPATGSVHAFGRELTRAGERIVVRSEQAPSTRL